MKKLKRSISLSSAIAISLGGMLGSGIFVLPGIAASKTGPSVWLAYLLAAVCILPAALSKSELATAMPNSGGTYIYIERTFGPIFGTIAGIGLWLSLLLKSAFALIGFGAYLTVMVNINEGFTKTLALFFLCLILVLNIFGIKKVAKVQIVVVTISLLTLGLILLFGIPNINSELLQPAFNHGSSGLISTIAFVYISYAGVTKIAAIGGEIINPGKNLPRAMILSLFIMTMVYVLVAFVLVGNIPIETLKNDIKPIFTIADMLGGTYIGHIVAAVGVITLVSMANSGVLASSRFPFAMAIDKLLPSFMGRIHPKFLTPVTTILMTGAVMSLVILFFDVEKIAKLASAFMVMMFISVNAAVIVLRETAAQWYNPPYRSPLYPFVQIFGIISGIVLLVFLGGLSLLSIAFIVILGCLVYLKFGVKTARTGILRKYGHRPALYLWYNKKNKEKKGRILTIETKTKFLEGELIENAQVVVPLLGNETSPEMLVEIGGAINSKEKVHVANITEVPNQTFLDAMIGDNPKIDSLSRRFLRLSESKKIDIDFESIVTHNLSETIHKLSTQINCDWLVMGWNGRARTGILINNPIGWLMTHIDSNFALFKDNGVRYMSKILLALRPGRNDIKFVEVADRISQFYGASFSFLRVVPQDVSDEDLRMTIESSNQLLKGVKSDAEVIIKKSDDSLDAISKTSSGYDLLILGTPKRDNWIGVLFGSGRDRFTQKSVCSVLRLTIRD